MGVDDWRKLLSEPALLNLVSGLAALDRVYKGINSGSICYVGHSVPISLFLIGFLVGLSNLANAPAHDCGRSMWSRYASYSCLILGVVAILLLVGYDAYNAANGAKTCPF
jgi:hypothetical protein